MKNPLLNLWLRFESEKKNILQKLKGQASHYLGIFLLLHLHIMYLYQSINLSVCVLYFLVFIQFIQNQFRAMIIVYDNDINVQQDFCLVLKQVLDVLGLDEEYMGEQDQLICIVRLTRETLLSRNNGRFLVSATLVGLAERQMEEGKPRQIVKTVHHLKI